MTPKQQLPGKQRSDGELLVDFLKRRVPGVARLLVETTQEALGIVARHEVDLVLMGSKVISMTKAGKVEVINSTGSLAFAQTAHDSGTPMGVVSASYKLWPTDTYEKYGDTILDYKTEDAHTSDKISESLVDWIVTEHGVYDVQTFADYHQLWFQHDTLPVARFLDPCPSQSETYKYWETQLGLLNVPRIGASTVDEWDPETTLERVHRARNAALGMMRNVENVYMNGNVPKAKELYQDALRLYPGLIIEVAFDEVLPETTRPNGFGTN